MGGTVIMACRSVDKASDAKKTIVQETKCNPDKVQSYPYTHVMYLLC